MKTRSSIKVAEQIEEQEMLGLMTFLDCERKHFVDLGLTGSVPAANYTPLCCSLMKHTLLKNSLIEC